MNGKTLSALVALNLALLVAVLVTSFAPAPVEAQTRGRKADYVMVAGEAIGRPNDSLVYIIDTQSAKTVVVLVNSGTKDLQVIERRDMANDFVMPASR